MTTQTGATFGQVRDTEQFANLREWVESIATLTAPAHLHWVDGSREENQALLREMVRDGKLIKLNPDWRQFGGARHSKPGRA